MQTFVLAMFIMMFATFAGAIYMTRWATKKTTRGIRKLVRR
jgi:hypothetical protein